MKRGFGCLVVAVACGSAIAPSPGSTPIDRPAPVAGTAYYARADGEDA